MPRRTWATVCIASTAFSAFAVAPPLVPHASANGNCSGDIALIRVRGSGDAHAPDSIVDAPGFDGNTHIGTTLNPVSMQLRVRAAAAGKTVNEVDLDYPALGTGTIAPDAEQLL